VSSLPQSRTLAHTIVARAKIVLWSVEGIGNTEIANCLEWGKATVGSGAAVLSSGVCPDCR
jgi:hypothetical protein